MPLRLLLNISDISTSKEPTWHPPKRSPMKPFTAHFLLVIFVFNFIPLTTMGDPVIFPPRLGSTAQSSAAQTYTMAMIYHLCSSVVPDGPFTDLFPYVTGREINQASNLETRIALYFPNWLTLDKRTYTEIIQKTKSSPSKAC